MKYSRAKTKKCRKKTSDLDLVLRSTHAGKLSVREMSVESFSNDDGGGNENVKKAIGLLNKTTSLHVHRAFLYISLLLLHDYDVKMPSFTSYIEDEKQATTNFSFSF